MKRIIFALLLIILATLYIAQKELIYKRIIRERQAYQSQSIEIVQKHKPRQQVELLGYPAPGDEPGYPYPYQPTATYNPQPTPTYILPTPAPTMNPMED